MSGEPLHLTSRDELDGHGHPHEEGHGRDHVHMPVSAGTGTGAGAGTGTGTGASTADGHGHGHGHGHGRPVPAIGHRTPLAIVLGISTAILVVEAIGAFLSGSLALLADAAHMLTDAAGLTLALVAAVLAGRPATEDRTWGYRRAEVLAAAAQAAVLLAVGGFVLAEAIRRLIEPSPVASGVMIVFGIVGLAGNAVSIVLLTRITGGNLNTRAARLEVVNDALGSVAVLIAAVVICRGHRRARGRRSARRRA